MKHQNKKSTGYLHVTHIRLLITIMAFAYFIKIINSYFNNYTPLVHVFTASIRKRNNVPYVNYVPILLKIKMTALLKVEN